MVQTWAAYKRFLFALLVLGNGVMALMNPSNEKTRWANLSLTLRISEKDYLHRDIKTNDTDEPEEEAQDIIHLDVTPSLSVSEMAEAIIRKFYKTWIAEMQLN